MVFVSASGNFSLQSSSSVSLSSSPTREDCAVDTFARLYTLASVPHHHDSLPQKCNLAICLGDTSLVRLSALGGHLLHVCQRVSQVVQLSEASVFGDPDDLAWHTNNDWLSWYRTLLSVHLSNDTMAAASSSFASSSQ